MVLIKIKWKSDWIWIAACVPSNILHWFVRNNENYFPRKKLYQKKKKKKAPQLIAAAAWG